MEMSWMNLSLRGARLVDEGWRSIRSLNRISQRLSGTRTKRGRKMTEMLNITQLAARWRVNPRTAKMIICSHGFPDPGAGRSVPVSGLWQPA
jgi:hypothetical protein